jgi:hypothetical protein
MVLRMWRWLFAAVLIPALAFGADEVEPKPAESSGLTAVLIGAAGMALTGGYLAGAFLTGDRPSAIPLAVSGGIVTGGLLGAGLALGINSTRKDPGSLVRYILVPVLAGLAGAAVGGLATGFGSSQPGTGRTVTHVVVITFLIAETLVLEFAR